MVESKGFIRQGIRSAAILIGSILLAQLFAPSMHRSDGSILPDAWILAIGGLSLIALGASWGTHWQQAGCLFSLALFGQACALALVKPTASYQRYYLWRELFVSARGLLLAGPILQTVVAITAAPKLWHIVQKGRELLPSFSWAALIGILMFLMAARPVFRVRWQVEQMSLGGWFLVANIANLILLAAALPSGTLDNAAAWTSRLRSKRLLPWAVALWVLLISASISSVVFERVPHVSDSVSYLIQAKYFSAGKLYLPAPPDAAAFGYEKLYDDGSKWWAYGFPGWPAVLSLGVLAGAPWLVNPIIGALTILFSYSLIRRLYDQNLAVIVVLLLAVSPWFLFMSATFMSHPSTLLWTVVALLSIEKERQRRHGLWGCLGGVSMGALLLTRPFEAVLLGPVILLWCLWPFPSRLSWRGLMGMGLAGLMVAGLIFPYNHAITGSFTEPPHNKYVAKLWYPGADRLGFGPEIGNVNWPHLDAHPGHGLVDVLMNTHLNSFMANWDLFGWSFGSLAFALLALFWRRVKRADKMFWWFIGSIIAGHSLYWFSGGPDFGARYWYQILLPLVVLTGRGITELQNRWSEVRGAGTDTPRIFAFLAAACLISLINFVPWRILDKYHNFWGIRAEMARFAGQQNFGHALVFVRAADEVDYVSALVLNPPTLDSRGTLYVRDLGPESRAAIAKHFPDRPVWIVAAPVPLGPYQVVSAPLTASTAGGISHP